MDIYTYIHIYKCVRKYVYIYVSTFTYLGVYDGCVSQSSLSAAIPPATQQCGLPHRSVEGFSWQREDGVILVAQVAIACHPPQSLV